VPKICLGEDGFVKLGPGDPATRDEILRFAQKEGFQGIELHGQFESYIVTDAGSVKNYYASFAQEIPGLQTGHVGFFHPPISTDEATRNEYVSGVEEAQRFAEAIGAHHCTLTPPVFLPEMAPMYDRLLDRYVKVVGEVVANAEKHNVVMAIEPEPNLFLNGGTFRDSIEDVRMILGAVKSKNLAILYDISHVNIISHGDPVGFLKQLNGRVSWVHIADNDLSLTPIGTGKHLIFGEGNVDMIKLFYTMKEELSSLEWLQIDTWENPEPFVAAKRNKGELEKILKIIDWS
jgi:sugar phosphate isomerase/epimerase